MKEFEFTPCRNCEIVKGYGGEYRCSLCELTLLRKEVEKRTELKSKQKTKIRNQAIKEFAERLKQELVEGIDSNMRCMDKQKEPNELWHNCLGKKTACQGILDIVEGYVEEMMK